MTKVERIKAALNFEPVDKVPYSFWTHMPQYDRYPDKMAQATYKFYKEYDLDFIKMMQNGVYSCEDFGCTVDYSEVLSGGANKVIETPVHSPEDWLKIQKPDVTKGSYGRELEVLNKLKALVGNEAPILFTIFSPLTTADKMVGGNILEELADGHGKEIHYALDIITETTCDLVREIMKNGADGIFFATKLASFDFTTEDVYEEYGKKYDVRVIDAANKAGGWFNLLHAHGTDIMYDLVKDYPTQAFNWHAFESYPSLSEARDLTQKCLVGGIKRYNITDNHKNDIRHEIYECLTQLKGKGHILTPGCTIRYPLNKDTLTYVRKVKEEMETTLRSEHRL